LQGWLSAVVEAAGSRFIAESRLVLLLMGFSAEGRRFDHGVHPAASRHETDAALACVYQHALSLQSSQPKAPTGLMGNNAHHLRRIGWIL
jgi:hypothetical protein